MIFLIANLTKYTIAPLECHESCKDTCSGPGQKSCDECKEGWVADEEDGCKGE